MAVISVPSVPAFAFQICLGAFRTAHISAWWHSFKVSPYQLKVPGMIPDLMDFVNTISAAYLNACDLVSEGA